MTTFIKTKLKKSDDQTVIDKYIEATKINIILYISSLESLFQIDENKAIISSKKCM